MQFLHITPSRHVLEPTLNRSGLIPSRTASHRLDNFIRDKNMTCPSPTMIRNGPIWPLSTSNQAPRVEFKERRYRMGHWKIIPCPSKHSTIWFITNNMTWHFRLVYFVLPANSFKMTGVILTLRQSFSIQPPWKFYCGTKHGFVNRNGRCCDGMGKQEIREPIQKMWDCC